MYNSLKMSLSFIILFIFSLGAVQADCIVTTKNFSKSSRVIYVNPTNGSDQLAKIYNYNLGNQRNPYDPKRIVAFQNLDEALATRNTRNGDLVLIKTGRIWTRYDDWSKNKSSEFNKQSAQASGYSQRQCQGENLTWVPSAVTDTQSADTAPTPTTEFARTNDITVANTEIVRSTNTTPDQVTTTQQSPTSQTTSRRSSGGASSGADSLSTSDNILPLEQSETTSYSRGSNTSLSQNTITETPLRGEVIADLDPSITDEVVDVPPISGSEQDIVEPIYVPECSAEAAWGNKVKKYPQDSKGWSIIKPDSETRIVYVSSTSGSDNYARYYLSSEISDPFNPPSNINAYRTLEQAYAQLRDKKPDWILLKRGDRYELQDALGLKSGKSQNAQMVISSYGDKNLPRPLVDSYTSSAFSGKKVRSFITISGIEFYASGRDPDSDRFVGWDKVGSASGVSYVAGGDSYGIHIENNRFSFYSGGIGMQGHAGEIKDIVIRRNQVLNSYSTTAHSQGLYLSKLNGALIEENFLDHNGWYQQRPSNVGLNTKSYGYATFFNHNVYIQNSSNLLIRKNLSSRSSSIGMKFTSNSDNTTKVNTVNSRNIMLDGNLIVEGEVGFSIGGNTDFNNGFRWDNIKVLNNVLSNIGRTKPTNRNLSFNIEANDWEAGSICHNSIVDRDDKTMNNNYGIDVKGHIGGLNISDNQIINFGLEEEAYSEHDRVKSKNNRYIPLIENVNYLDNYVRSKGHKDYVTYINSVRDRLRKNSHDYYNVDEAIDYIELQANY